MSPTSQFGYGQRCDGADLALADCEDAVTTQPLTIVLLGAPGSGKGTQAVRLCERYRLAAISTGEILRAAVIRGSPLGQRVKATLDSGGLVDDETMGDLVRDRLGQPDAARGVVLDGFPRSLAQAQALDEMLGHRPCLAVVLMVPTGELERRLQSRRICLKCRTIYGGGTAYGSEEELCSRCGIALIRRDDDNNETIKHRLATYRAMVAPLLEYYRSRSALVTIDGTQGPDAVFRAMLRDVDAATARASTPIAPTDR
jgi:adenylate kinase